LSADIQSPLAKQGAARREILGWVVCIRCWLFFFRQFFRFESGKDDVAKRNNGLCRVQCTQLKLQNINKPTMEVVTHW